MRKLIYSLLGLSLVLLFAACKTEKFVRPVVDLELVGNEVQLSLVTTELATATVDVRNGNSGYTVETSDEHVATATNEGTGAEITIKGISEGTAVITVTDALGKTATIDVVVSVLTPTRPTFTWEGQSVKFDQPSGYGITVMPGVIALTDIIDGSTQYIMSWTGGFSEGEKTDAELSIIGPDIEEPVAIKLKTLKFLKVDAESNEVYIVFSDGANGGQLYFTDYIPK